MKYLNLQRVFSVGAAALLLALPLTSCSKEGSSEPVGSSTGTSVAQTTGTGVETAASGDAVQSDSTTAASGTTQRPASSANQADSTDGTKPGAEQSDQTTAAAPDSSAPQLCGDPLTAAPGEKRVAVPVKVKNNPGFAVIGLSLFYDAALTGVTVNTPAADFTLGDAAPDLNAQCFVNQDRHTVGFAGYQTENVTADGTLFTCYFDVPEDAKSGQVYQFSMKLTEATTLTGEKVSLAAAGFPLTVR